MGPVLAISGRFACTIVVRFLAVANVVPYRLEITEGGFRPPGVSFGLWPGVNLFAKVSLDGGRR